jgi:Skp family chaperone for outer membrane proteins
MKIRIAPLLFSAFCAGAMVFAVGYTTFAQDSDSRAYKIGIVNLQRIMDDYDKRADEVAKVETETKARMEELKALQEELKTAEDSYEAERDSLSADARDEREADIESRTLKLRSEVSLAQGEHEQKLLRLKKDLLQDILLAIETIGSEENYHLILESDPETRTGVVYHSSTMNMTQKVVDRLNTEYAKTE